MQFGICPLSVIPLRENPDDRSEMVSQLLFGESFEVLIPSEKWMQIRCTQDDYEGWVDNKQVKLLEKKVFEKIRSSHHGVALELVQSATGRENHIPVIIGSTLPEYDGISFMIGKDKYVYNGQATDPGSNQLNASHIARFSLKYLNAPYLWGGRSPFGIDCSGLTQVLFKICGIGLPRDAYQQAATGSPVDFVHQSKEGDLAFFDNEEGKIIHVGIVLNDARIIHASGKVRIDKLDHHGIYNEELQRYSHKLRIIKRVAT